MSRLAQLARAVAGRVIPRESGRDSELRFWREYLARRPACLGDAKLRERVFPPSLRRSLEAIRGRDAGLPRVLELGSGPVSLLAAGVEQRWCELLAIDPLAREYAAMLARFGLRFPVVPLAGCGETLFEGVPERAFDVAYSGNAIDHATAPRDCVRNLARAVKPGGRVILEGFCREGSNAGWEGLHQHDLVAESGHLVHYDRRGVRTVITADLGLACVGQSIGPFSEKGVRWFGYEPETPSGGTCGWFEFPWYTLELEVRG